ncbi:MAG: bifunctional aspartate kinase/homoserine dehydrogenase I [Ekhidna sp.]
MKVLKFGGSSLGSSESLQRVRAIIGSDKFPLIVVVSATGNTTDELQQVSQLACHGDLSYLSLLLQLEEHHLKLYSDLVGETENNEILSVFDQLRQVCKGVYLLKELTDKSLDFILGSGELLSSIILSAFLVKEGVDATLFDSRQIIKTDNSFGNALVDFERTKRNLEESSSRFTEVNVFPGFIASTDGEQTTTLGRGGSDYTASILASILKAEVVEIWTDVDGIMTADPRLVNRSHTLKHVSYREALELSHFGAKVLYFQSILPAYKEGIPLKVKNTFSPALEGTLVSNRIGDTDLIKGIASTDDISVLSVSGNHLHSNDDFFSRLFKVLADEKVHVVFTTYANAEYTVTLGLRSTDSARALKSIKAEFKNSENSKTIQSLVVDEGYSLLALVGDNMRDQVGVSGKMFNVLGKNGVSIKAIAQGSSERNISAIIPKSDLNKALNVLHESFFLSEVKRINLFVIGTGNVGKAFLNQVTKQFSYLKKHHQLNIKAIGVANSRKMNFNKDGIPLSKWEKYLNEGEKFSTKDFINTMTELNFRNSIFIDITGAPDISNLYLEILKKSISVVTPNKIAATRSYEDYLALKSSAKRYRSQFLIETNVCAGLPVLSTLSDLIRSGDKVIKMEAVLSGTLNFLFNEYDGSKPFSEVIKYAKALGYTEPDPRLDISGEDVMRKLLILIRESGHAVEMNQLEATPFLPSSCQQSETLDEFYAKVEAEEEYFKSLYQKSLDSNTRLKVVASYANGVGTVSLKEIASSHPFYNLEGKDNVVLFYTNRYNEQPLVIKGAGAGAEVTASGIFADVLRIAQSDF